jgi:GntR family transcriptional regulator
MVASRFTGLPGEHLPTVRAIADQYSVSLATARKALSVLAEDGLITVTPGWGSFVR